MLDETALDELVSLWERERAQGRDLAAATMCRDRPELRPELERRIQAIRQIDRLVQGETQTAHGRSDDAHTEQIEELSKHFPTMPGYELLSELGRGGMGVVYRARQTKLNRVVALKMILSRGFAGTADVLRFQGEAESIARLQHPNIVQIHEVGDFEGRPFFSLEYCGGGSLANTLGGTPLSAQQAAALLEKLAGAMEAAHARQIVHRDLKPANVLLTEDGTPKITDFGLAKRLDEAGQTQSGAIMGTPSYMAPEQAAGQVRGLSAAADVYSLGAILYECLTGRPPFRADTSLETLSQVLHIEPLPPSRLMPKLPRDLETICLTCLRKEPQKRYASAAALADDLRRFLAGEPIRSRRAGLAERFVRQCRRHPVVSGLLALVAVILVGGVSGILYFAISASANARQANEARVKAEEAAASETTAHRLARESLIRQHIAAGTHSLEANDRATGLWSYAHAWELDQNPDAADSHRLRLGFTLQDGPRLVGVCFHQRPVLDASFDPAGKIVLTRTDEPRAYLWDAAASRLAAPPLAHDGEVRAATFNPAGDRVATGSADGTVRLWDPRSGQLLRTLPQGGAVHSIAYHRDGKLLAAATEKGEVLFWDVETGETAAPTLSLDVAVYHVAFSPDGRQVVTADAGHVARVWDVASGRAVTGPLPHQDVRAENETAISYRCWPVFSPDGSALATAHPNRRKGPGIEAAAVIWDLATGQPRYPPFKREYFIWQMHFSPDGSRLFVNNGDVIHRLDAATGKMQQPSLAHPRETQHSCLCPNGKVLASCSTGGLIHVWNPATGEESDEPLRCADGVHSLVFSPDGKNLLAASHDGTARVWRLADNVRLQQYKHDCGHADRIVWRVKDDLVRISPDGSRRVHYNGPNGAKLKTRGGVEFPLEHPKPVVFTRFSDDGQRLLTQDEDATVRCWNTATGELVGQPISFRTTLLSADFGGDNRRLLTLEGATPDGGEGPGVSVWDVERGALLFGPLRTWDTGPQRFGDKELFQRISEAALSKDGTRLALASDATGAVGVWDVDGRHDVAHKLGHRGNIYQIQFSADGQRFFTYGSDTVARLWDAATAEPVGPPLRHPRFCKTADLAPDGWRVATVDAGNVIRLWDGRSGDQLGRVELPLTNRAVWFSRDGQRLIIDGGKQALDLPVHSGGPEDLPKLLRLLTGLQRDPDDSVSPVDPLLFRNDAGLYRQVWNAWRAQADDASAQPSGFR
jgi:WD40 repeat protein/tRNA A-37 threonylcarbamoyl transferase component Bud32